MLLFTSSMFLLCVPLDLPLILDTNTDFGYMHPFRWMILVLRNAIMQFVVTRNSFKLLGF